MYKNNNNKKSNLKYMCILISHVTVFHCIFSYKNYILHQQSDSAKRKYVLKSIWLKFIFSKFIEESSFYWLSSLSFWRDLPWHSAVYCLVLIRQALAYWLSGNFPDFLKGLERQCSVIYLDFLLVSPHCDGTVSRKVS